AVPRNTNSPACAGLFHFRPSRDSVAFVVTRTSFIPQVAGWRPNLGFATYAESEMRAGCLLRNSRCAVMQAQIDAWRSGAPYERYVGRWSRRIAPVFLAWLEARKEQDWGDVGCGTGALAAAILADLDPRSLVGIDASPAFLEQARRRLNDPRVSLQRGDATGLPWASRALHATVSGLVLNFVGKPEAMVAEMVRVTRPGGIVGIYVWDYAAGMQMIRSFWDAAAAVDPASRSLDEGARFPNCRPDALAQLLQAAGLCHVEFAGIEVETVFQDIDDYWEPFLGGTGPAPAYLASVSDSTRAAIRSCLESRLTPGDDGAIHLVARAWAAKGSVAP
ncbi:MAG: class I SAM-dependent methyltransferase, partial [Burkholderiaceae bacterium]